MVQIKQFTVEQPPTSGQVREQAFQALNTGDSLPLTVLGNQEVPKPEPKNIELDILQVTRLSDGGIRFMGRTAGKDIVFLRTGDDELAPATGEMIG